MNKINVRLFLVLAILILLLGGAFWVSQKFDNDAAKIDTSQTAVVQKVQALGNLETTSFTIEKVITAGTEQNNFVSKFLFGDNLLLIAQGKVIAGFDLSQISADQIRVKGDEVAIFIGEPKILSATLNSSQTKVYDRQTGFLNRGDKDLESEARLAAENSIRDAACQSGILDEAEKNGKEMIEKIFTFAGFERVIVETKRGNC